MKCPACGGRCWVDSKHKGPSICPVCKGTGSVVAPIHGKEKTYDQDEIWTELTNSPPLDFEKELDIAVQVLDNPAVKACTINYSFIVHLLLDRNITPHGNLILEQIRRGQLQTGQAQEKLPPDHLRARGYVVLANGDVQVVDDIPVGPFYNTLAEWGVNRYSVWGMKCPIKIDLNRKGNPLFMDNNMVAFRATYTDTGHIRGSLEALNIFCTEGVVGKPELKPVGRIVKLRLFFLVTGI